MGYDGHGAVPVLWQGLHRPAFLIA